MFNSQIDGIIIHEYPPKSCRPVVFLGENHICGLNVKQHIREAKTCFILTSCINLETKHKNTCHGRTLLWSCLCAKCWQT